MPFVLLQSFATDPERPRLFPDDRGKDKGSVRDFRESVVVTVYRFKTVWEPLETPGKVSMIKVIRRQRKRGEEGSTESMKGHY